MTYESDKEQFGVNVLTIMDCYDCSKDEAIDDIRGFLGVDNDSPTLWDWMVASEAAAACAEDAAIEEVHISGTYGGDYVNP